MAALWESVQSNIAKSSKMGADEALPKLKLLGSPYYSMMFYVDVWVVALMNRVFRGHSVRWPDFVQWSFYSQAVTALSLVYLLVASIRNLETAKLVFWDRIGRFSYVRDLAATAVLWAQSLFICDWLELGKHALVHGGSWTVRDVVLGTALVLAGWFLADIASWVGHFGGDTFGPAAFFEAHHLDPLDMTRRTYAGRCYDITLIALTVRYITRCNPPSLFLTVFFTGACVTNEVHNYCHVGPKSRPGFIRLLQECRIILHPNMHLKHHLPPYSVNHAILNGWSAFIMNPLATGITATLEYFNMRPDQAAALAAAGLTDKFRAKDELLKAAHAKAQAIRDGMTQQTNGKADTKGEYQPNGKTMGNGMGNGHSLANGNGHMTGMNGRVAPEQHAAETRKAQ